MFLKSIGCVSVAILLGAGCTVVVRNPPPPPPPVVVSAPPPPPTVVYSDAPAPAPIVQVVPARPWYGAVWVPGHWDRRPHRWVWVGGYWR